MEVVNNPGQSPIPKGIPCFSWVNQPPQTLTTYESWDDSEPKNCEPLVFGQEQKMGGYAGAA